MKILIWGTGYLAQNVLESGINGEILGFIETKKSKDKFRDYPVYDCDKIPDNYDFIIVANIFSNEVYKVCRELKLDISKIVFLKRGSGIDFNPDIKIRDVLGERKYTEYAGEYGTWKNTFFEDDKIKYSMANTRPEFAIREECLWPIIADKYAMNSGMSVYFWQDLWAAKHIIAQGVKEHYDIGSRVDGFIAHLLAADIRVNVIDIRPFPGNAENLFTIVDDATMLKQFSDNSIHSLSALCSLEHFGLGRFGDPVDPEACFKCFAQIQRKLVKGGRLYISVPIGKERVEFNAHRIFKASTIIESFGELTLKEFSVTTANRIDYDVDIHKYDDLSKTHVVGLFMFEK